MRGSFAFFLLPALLAQSPSPIRVNVNLIQIDVTVTDKQGRHPADLTAADFELLQNGKRQPITSALWVPARPPVPPPPPGAPPVPLAPEQVRRTIAILVDDLSLSLASLHYSRQALRQFVETSIQPGDLVALYKTSAGLGVLQQFTTDKRQLLANIDRMTLRNVASIDGLAPLGANLNEDSSNAGVAEMALRMRLQEEATNQLRQDSLAASSLGSARFIVQGLSELPGRKSLVYFSENLQLYDLPASLTNPGMTPEMQNLGNLEGGRRSRTLAAIRDLVDLANRYSVVFYTIDPRGVVYTGLTAADRPSSNPRRMMGQMQERVNFVNLSRDGLSLLAEETGGVFYRNRNDLAEALNDAVADQEGYYLLGFTPDDETFQKSKNGIRYHQLQVKLKRPALRARYRRGFLGATDAERIPPPASPIFAAMMSPFRSTGVSLKLTPLFLQTPESGPFLRSLIHLETKPIAFQESPAEKTDKDQTPWMEANVVLAAFLFGDNGTIIEKVTQSQRLRVRRPAFDQLLRDGVTQQLDIPLNKAGAYQLRAAILDSANQKAGSASQFIEVPDLKEKRLALSGLALYGDDFQQGKSLLSSPALRQLRPGERFTFGAIAYHAGKAPLLQVSLYRDGKLVHRGKTEPVAAKPDPTTGLRNIEAALTLSPTAAPGDYAVELAVQDPSAPKKRQFAVRQIDFTVR